MHTHNYVHMRTHIHVRTHTHTHTTYTHAQTHTHTHTHTHTQTNMHMHTFTHSWLPLSGCDSLPGIQLSSWDGWSMPAHPGLQPPSLTVSTERYSAHHDLPGLRWVLVVIKALRQVSWTKTSLNPMPPAVTGLIKFVVCLKTRSRFMIDIVNYTW